MGEIRETGYNLPITNFAEDNESNISPTVYYDFSSTVSRSRKRRRELNFLTKKNSQYFNSRVAVVDLTRNDGQFVSRRIPVIDLTEEDVMEITDQIQCIDLTNDDSLSNNHPNRHLELKRKIDSSSNSYSNRHFELTRNDDSLSTSHLNRHLELTRNGDSSNNSHHNHHFELKRNGDSSSNSHLNQHFELPRNDDSSSNNHPNHHFELTGNDDSSNNSQPNHQFELTRNSRDTNCSSERFNLSDHDGQSFIPNVQASDLTCYNDEFTNYRIPDRKHNNGHNITHQLQYTGLTDGKQQHNVNECIPTNTLTYDIGQIIDQNIPPIHLTSRVNYENYSRPMFDLPPDNTDNIVHDAEALNLTDQFTPSSDAIRNDTVVREPIDIAGMYDAEVRSCNNLPTNYTKQAPEINPRIPFESPRYDVAELNILKCNEASNMNFMHISTSSSMQQLQCKKEIISKNSHPETINYHQKDLRPGKYVKIPQINTSDLLKPASHPIPFRHSLGRSTVNTSKNVLIESTEVSKNGSRKMTVSSTLRRRKAKSSSGIPKQNLPNSLINIRNQLQEQAHFPLELLKNCF